MRQLPQHESAVRRLARERPPPRSDLRVSEEALAEAKRLNHEAPWRLDFVAAGSSMGFHAPQEMARILGGTIDFARQRPLEANRAQQAAASAAAPAPERAG